MSSPLATTSVATKNYIYFPLKPSIALSLSGYDLSPWIAVARNCSLFRSLEISSAPLLVAENIITLLEPTMLLRYFNKRSSLSFYFTMSIFCFIFIFTVLSDDPICICIGCSWHKSRANLRTYYGHVAVNIIVWRSGLIYPTIFRI